MNLQLTDKYSITTDKCNVILNKAFTAKNGTQKTKEIGYYSSFEKAASGALFHGLKHAEITGLKAIIRKLDEIESEIKENLLIAVNKEEV